MGRYGSRVPAPDDAGLEEPLVPASIVEDASLLRRFGAEYRGPHAAEDALRWLAHPDDAGPSGAASPLAALQPLRAALYRSGAGAAELDAYRRAEEAIRADRREAWVALQAVLGAGALARPASAAAGSSEVPAGHLQAAAAHAARGRRPLIVVAVAVGLALVAGGGFAMLRSGSAIFTGATPHPTPTAAPVVTVDAHPADFETLSATSEAALLTAAFESMSSPAAVKARDDLLAAPDASLPVPSAGNLLLDANDREDGAATNGNGAYVRAHPARVGDGGTLQLHVVTKQPASWSWRVLVMDRSTHVVRTAFVVVGAQDHGQLQSASLMLGRDEVPAGMRLSVAPRTPYFWTAGYLY